jgi:hypothetical protein
MRWRGLRSASLPRCTDRSATALDDTVITCGASVGNRSPGPPPTRGHPQQVSGRDAKAFVARGAGPRKGLRQTIFSKVACPPHHLDLCTGSGTASTNGPQPRPQPRRGIFMHIVVVALSPPVRRAEVVRQLARCRRLLVCHACVVSALQFGVLDWVGGYLSPDRVLAVDYLRSCSPWLLNTRHQPSPAVSLRSPSSLPAGSQGGRIARHGPSPGSSTASGSCRGICRLPTFSFCRSALIRPKRQCAETPLHGSAGGCCAGVERAAGADPGGGRRAASIVPSRGVRRSRPGRA